MSDMTPLNPRIAVIPGSFDPMTLGHRNIIERAAKLYDQVIVGLLINDQKQYLFTQDERKIIARLTLHGIKNVKIETDSGFLTDFCVKMGAGVIVKGVRTPQDFVYEQEMATYNRARNPALETVYLPAEESLADVSSTVVRSALTKDGSFDARSLEGLLHPAVIAWLAQGKRQL